MILLLKVLAIFLASLLVLSSQIDLAHAISNGIMVPLYTEPGSTWDAVLQTKLKHPLVPIIIIINPDNGSGQVQDPNYLAGIQRLQSGDITVLGYISTNYAARNYTEIKTEITNYKSWYNVNGIFFDEMSYASGNETFYRHISEYAKSIGLNYTAGNAGTDTLPSYIGMVDNIVIYDNPGLPEISSLGGWHKNFTKSNFSIMAFGIDKLNPSYVDMASNYIKYIYITNGTAPNPWNSLPSYFENLVASIPTKGSGYSAISVSAADPNGNLITGQNATLWQNGLPLQSGYLPHVFDVNNFKTYQVAVTNHGSYVFDHWGDGTKNRLHDIIAGNSTTTSLVAVYRTMTLADYVFQFLSHFGKIQF